MHGIWGEQPVDLVRPHDLRRDAGRDVLFSEPPRRVLGEDELLEVALLVLQRHGHGVPAIEHDRAVMIAVLPDRPAAAGPGLVAVFIERFAAAPERRLSV